MEEQDGIKHAVDLFFNGAELIDGIFTKEETVKMISAKMTTNDITAREALDQGFNLIKKLRACKGSGINPDTPEKRQTPYTKYSGVRIVCEGCTRDDEYWHRWTLVDKSTIPPDWSKDNLLFDLDMTRYYGGPGRAFADNGWIKEDTVAGLLVVQRGGLDV